MLKKWRIKVILDEMQEVEEDIVILRNNIAKAREYLLNNKAEDIDIKYFNDTLDIEQGLKHIEIF